MAIDGGDILLKVGVDKKSLDKDMKGLSGAINKHKKAVGIAMVGLGVAALAGVASSIKAFAEMGDEVQKMALRVGFSTEALSEWRHVANISGADISTLEKGVKKMSKTIVDADEGMATYIRSFDRIGLSAEELMALSPEDQFTRITEAIAALESPTLRAATAQDIFGRAGTALLPMMAAGAEGIAELREEAHTLGIVFDQEAANAAAEFQDSMTRLDGAMNGAKFTLAKELLPALEAGIPILESWAKHLGPIIENTLNWRAAEDRRSRAARSWDNLEHQRFLFRNNQNNQYEESIRLVESIMRSQGSLTEGTARVIESLRAEIKAREDLETVVEDTNEDLEEQIKLQEEQEELFKSTTETLDDIIKTMKLERSEAGKLGLEVDDVVKTLIDMDVAYEDIRDTLIDLGDEQDDVLKVMEAFGLSAIEIAEAIGMEDDAIKMLLGTLGKLDSAKQKASGNGRADDRVDEDPFGMGEIGRIPFSELNDEQISEGWNRGGHFWVPEKEDMDALRERMEGGLRENLAGGGIAMHPITANIAEKGPEAVIPLDRLEGMLGKGQMMTIIQQIDGREISRTVMPYVVGEIRLRTGMHISGVKIMNPIKEKLQRLFTKAGGGIGGK